MGKIVRTCHKCGQHIVSEDELLLGVQLAGHLDEKHPEAWKDWKEDIIEMEELVDEMLEGMEEV